MSVACFRIRGVVDFLSAYVTERGFSTRVVRHGPSRRDNRTKWSINGNMDSDSLPKPPVLIALIDPKPFTRESILKMLDSSLSEDAKLLGVSCFNDNYIYLAQMNLLIRNIVHLFFFT